MKRKRPDLNSLFKLASAQSGFFTSAQAAEFGIGPALCWHYLQQGRLLRRRRGLYRFSDFWQSPAEDLFAGLLAVGIRGALISHQSALALHDLMRPPSTVHITIPRSMRRVGPPGVTLHTAVTPPGGTERTEKKGIPVTTPVRSLVDFASQPASSEQLAQVVRRAVELGQVSTTHLLFAAQERSRKVSSVIRAALEA